MAGLPPELNMLTHLLQMLLVQVQLPWILGWLGWSAFLLDEAGASALSCHLFPSAACLWGDGSLLIRGDLKVSSKPYKTQILCIFLRMYFFLI